MTIAVAAEGNTGDSKTSDRFARSPWFLLFSEDGRFLKALKTDPSEHGAAAMAVGLLAENGVQVVLAPQLGPNAVTALRQGDIKAYACSAATAQEAVKLYLSGDLERLA
ncbi:hypothetical protein TheveDRAFT_0025 [Thermanaerovibrio velox DSM 12556]|uniref:Dinitrogenase iron-molybdenum cofactor biosynthesis domain-containing protein n=1 Tax=Thermanaerovibrio velox DSM 12556 TaxID=926567 RepID=H0UMR9_9BACT|nr:NifB/NifX family molybdenum-iron cluster-binding protein [Thermanaerovibrio velox]EHM09214.1 hypothetical protein TheveDRAFT_0025 [Thermanaerovibrio velox DSM 12556]